MQFHIDLLLCLQISDLKCGQACGKNMTIFNLIGENHQGF